MTATILNGTSGRDFLVADNGNDSINGFADNDTIHGDSGNNEYLNTYYAGNDTINAGSGNDLVYGDGIAKLEWNNSVSENLVVLEDEIYYSVSGGNDSIDGGSGNDTIYGDVVVDSEWEVEVGALYGSNRDTIKGGSGDDWIDAGEGNDRVYGDTGNDIIRDGYGWDTVTGGSGNDCFVFEHDGGVITDFGVGIDKIDLRAFDVQFGDLGVSDDGTNTTVHVSAYGGFNIVLQNFDAVNLDASDFKLAEAV